MGFCHCARNYTLIPTIKDYHKRYHEKYELLVNDSRFHRDDFDVIIQPHMRNLVPPVDVNFVF